MKTKIYFILTVLLFSIFLVTKQACKKEEKTNEPPTCTITAPVNGQEIIKGETVTISAEATDSDGSIVEVRFFIDGVEKGATLSFPYNYDWNTSTESIGNHTIKATSKDNNGGSTSEEITVLINDGTGPFTDPRDGQTYNTVVIGTQTWFAENLNYQTANSWWYDNSPTYGDVYGRLYTWDDALTACPSGWHLPSDSEWTILADFLGGWEVAGGKMKEAGLAHWDSPNTGATNSSGFTGLPAGYHNESGFFNLGKVCQFWSSSENGDNMVWQRSLYSFDERLTRPISSKGWGSSVRCLKD